MKLSLHSLLWPQENIRKQDCIAETDVVIGIILKLSLFIQRTKKSKPLENLDFKYYPASYKWLSQSKVEWHHSWEMLQL